MPSQIRFQKILYFLIIHIFKIVPSFIKYFLCFKQRSLNFLLLSRSIGALYFPTSLQFSQSQIIFINFFFIYNIQVNVIKQIEKKIKNKINLEYINIIDNSKAHLSHKYFSKGKVHLILEIKSEYLKV